MKVLKIDEYQGYYSTRGKEYALIDKISKEDLLKLVDLTLEQEVTFDEFDEKKLKNQAHQIVYKSICDKLMELTKRKAEFKDESERLYLQEYEKYGGSVIKGNPTISLNCGANLEEATSTP